MIILNKEKGIISLAVVLTVGFFALSMALVNSMGALTELAKNRNTGFGENAFYNAEAAVGCGVYKYLEDYTNGSSSYSCEENLLINNSTSTIYVDEKNWPYIEIRGEAQNQRTFRGVSYLINLYTPGEAFDHAVYSGNYIIFTEANESFKKIIKGNIYAEGEIKNCGNNFKLTDYDSLTSPDPDNNIDKENCLSSDPSKSPDPIKGSIPFPYLDFGDLIYDKEFDDPEELEKYFSYISDNDFDISEEIIFLNSDSVLDIEDCLEVKALITKGDLNVINENTGIQGLVYVNGITILGGGGNCWQEGKGEDKIKIKIKGSLISLGGIVFEQGMGGQSILYDQEIANVWKEIVGPLTLGSSIPEIINWREF